MSAPPTRAQKIAALLTLISLLTLAVRYGNRSAQPRLDAAEAELRALQGQAGPSPRAYNAPPPLPSGQTWINPNDQIEEACDAGADGAGLGCGTHFCEYPDGGREFCSRGVNGVKTPGGDLFSASDSYGVLLGPVWVDGGAVVDQDGGQVYWWAPCSWIRPNCPRDRRCGHGPGNPATGQGLPEGHCVRVLGPQ